MKYNTDKHKRRSIRLDAYDYSQEGLYFVTLLCFQRIHLFGSIDHGKVFLTEGGRKGKSCWEAIPDHYPLVRLHEFVIMPNHLHGILEIIPHEKSKGEKSFAPNTNSFRSPSRTIGSVIRGFKIGVTKWYRKNTQIEKVWHRNYHEHIIRDISDYHRISTYIRDNPRNWEQDSYWT